MKASPDRAIDRVQRKTGRKRCARAPFDTRVKELVRDWGTQKSATLIEEIITTVLKIARDEMTVSDLKLINRSVKEMRSAAQIFVPFKHLRKWSFSDRREVRPIHPISNWRQILPAKWSGKASC